MNAPIRLSLNGYARAVCNLQGVSKALAASGNNDIEYEEGKDDYDMHRSIIGGFRRVPLPPENWRDEVSIELTKGEAKFLREKIIKSPHSKDSLLAHILRNLFFDVIIYDSMLKFFNKAADYPWK